MASETKKLTAMIVGGLLALVLAAGALVWFVPVFKVNEVTVAGNERVEQARVEESIGVPAGANLVRVNARDAAAKVAEIPWVATATVSRQFPSTLHVDLTEREAVAFVETGDGPHLIDADGREFIIDTPPQGAVEITGDSEPAAVAEAVDVLAALSAHSRGEVAALDIRDAVAMTLRLHDGRTVFWGANEDNANKARAFEAVLQLEGQNWDITNPELVTTRD